jgi:large subunit ribosomal protein L10
VRKSQLLRAYTSLLRSTPLILIFQHNNLTALEWAAIRRELNLALAEVSAPAASPVSPQASIDIASAIQLQVIRTRMLDQALKIVEFFDPASVSASATSVVDKAYTHDLSRAAYQAVKSAEASVPENSVYAQLAPLFVGPLALLTFPAVSPQHLAAALTVLSPSPPAFSAPSRKKNPGYYDIAVQNGLQKLLLVGGRIEGKVFDPEGVRWVGGIEGGLDGLRARLVAMLQSAGLSLTTTLDAAGKSLWLTMESRRAILEGEEEESTGAKKE